MSLEHAPPELRQQLRAPSAAIPLLAQTTDPPVWLHSLVAVHSAPTDRPPVLLLLPPPQALFRQTAPPQQWKSALQPPPALRQQLNCPSRMMPLSLQTTAPPAWLHSEFAPRLEHCPPSGTVFCAHARPGMPIGINAAANVAASPLITLRRDVAAATARAKSSNRNPSMLAYFSSSPPEAADHDSPLPQRPVNQRQCHWIVPHRTAEPGIAFAQRGTRTSLPVHVNAGRGGGVSTGKAGVFLGDHRSASSQVSTPDPRRTTCSYGVSRGGQTTANSGSRSASRIAPG